MITKTVDFLFKAANLLFNIVFDNLDDLIFQLVSIDLLNLRLGVASLHLFLEEVDVLAGLVNVVKHLLLLDRD